MVIKKKCWMPWFNQPGHLYLNYVSFLSTNQMIMIIALIIRQGPINMVNQRFRTLILDKNAAPGECSFTLLGFPLIFVQIGINNLIFYN